MKKYLLIANPHSGTNHPKEESIRNVARILSRNAKLRIEYTRYKGHGFKIAANAIPEKYDAIIALGGDGTINEIASALINSSIPLGIIPSGSGNGLARHLAIPINPEQAAQIILDDKIIACDYGTINSHPFFCTSGIGFDAKVSQKFAGSFKRGPLSYIQSIISELSGYKASEYLIECNGEAFRHKAFILTVCNASQYGNNAYISPQASITDGLLDMTVINEANPVQAITLAFEVMTGRINRDPLVKTYKSSEFNIIRKGATLIHIDGDPILIHGDLKFKCHKAGIRIFSHGQQTKTPLLAPWEQ